MTDRLDSDQAREDRIIVLFLAIAARVAREKAQAREEQRRRMRVVERDAA